MCDFFSRCYLSLVCMDWITYVYINMSFGFDGYFFFTHHYGLVGSLDMCMCLVFLYLHLFGATDHVSHGKAL